MTKTIDPSTGLEVKPTDNGLKDCDEKAPQVNRLLTEKEIEELISKAVG